MSTSSPIEDTPPLDPVYQHSRREAILIFSIWICALLWSVPYCYLNGYPATFNPDTFQTVGGVPAWVFWGIAVPWLVADVLTIFMCLFVIKDDDLEPTDGTDLAA